MSNAVAPSLIQDENFHAVTARLLSEQYPPDGGPRNNPKASRNPFDYVEYGLGIAPEQGELIYLLCRWLRTKRVAEFATSTLYLAAAMRDNGGGIVIGSELVSAKAAAARRNLRRVGLSDYAEIREGDARRTLRDLGGPVDFVLLDRWLVNDGLSLARQVIEIVAPQVRIGGYVMNDNAEPDFLEFVRDPANGFVRLTLPIKIGAELCVRVT
ncbi:O-methyltransferase [Bradyrhizobium valentinum]|uniref:O-methyltransferase n=1 Tax=Bradyrhizobium valentinum TaxID=1518501 RepID=UPI00070DE108|nr:class I SAM-dependent methyltransferase [Bradyrhizobium valentinum]KRQ95147.1 methyltransferase [Bradyrhizobium valentinum]